MTKSAVIKILLLLFISASTMAQKPKYKDIYGLLSTRQYELAEPFLKRYIAVERDNPNAFLFMGLIYQEKAAAKDVLKETSMLLSCIDSAVFFYDKAAATIDERELKRNREYYEAYNRRDLRTGEFGVSLSDIQFDLQKKKESLAVRAGNVKMVKHYFVSSDSLYRKCLDVYLVLKERYPTERALLLQAEDSTTALLAELATRFDSTRRFVRLYQSSMEGLGKSAYKQEFVLQNVGDYATDGEAAADFFAHQVQLWDYGQFAERITHAITNEINPLREELVTLDAELTKFGAMQDSTFIGGQLNDFRRRLPYQKLEKLDSNPLPLNLLELKLALLQFEDARSVSSRYQDSLDVNFQLHLAGLEAAALRRLDSIAQSILRTEPQHRARDYQHFITNVYGSAGEMTNFVAELGEYARRETERVSAVVNQRQDALRWILLQDERVPIMPGDSVLPYLPVLTEFEKYTLGLKFVDSTDVSGYFYSVTPSRIPDIRVTFPVDKENFLATVPALKGMAANANDLIYYLMIYSEAPVGDKFPATIAKIYRADGLSWSVNYQFDFVPESFEYNAGSGDLIVSDAQGSLVFDKNGKPKQD